MREKDYPVEVVELKGALVSYPFMNIAQALLQTLCWTFLGNQKEKDLL